MPPQRYHQFRSYWEFDAFEAELTRQLAARQVEIIAPATLALDVAPYLTEAYYRLAGSPQVWVLSSPDNAWRGYFLPLEEALARLQPTRSRWVGYALLLMVGLIAWLLLSYYPYWVLNDHSTRNTATT